MSEPAACLWCSGEFEPHRGGSPQRFCERECRTAFWTALRRWGDQAIADGVLTIAELKDGAPAACTLPGRYETRSPLSNIGDDRTVSPDVLLRFLVEVERGTVASLVRFRFIPVGRDDDLVAIIDALKRVGQTPRIWRIR